MSVSTWLERLMSHDRRSAERRRPYELIAHYWTGEEPRPRDVRDISSSGVYLVTQDRWYPGTLMMISLQRSGASESDPDRAITVRAQVIRADSTGVALSLIVPEKPMPVSSTFAAGADKKAVDRFLKRVRDDLKHARTPGSGDAFESGQALIEYVLMIPLLFILIVNLVNFGGFFFAWISVSNAARAGADYMAIGEASAGGPSPPSATLINNVITAELASLPNNPSVSINVCKNNNGTITTLSGTCSGIPSDPEAGSYVLDSVDVTYTYKPFIPAGFKFANLNLYATIPPTAIHRRAVVRSMN